MGIGGADNRNSFCRRNIYVGSHLRHDGNSPKRKGGGTGALGWLRLSSEGM